MISLLEREDIKSILKIKENAFLKLVQFLDANNIKFNREPNGETKEKDTFQTNHYYSLIGQKIDTQEKVEIKISNDNFYSFSQMSHSIELMKEMEVCSFILQTYPSLVSVDEQIAVQVTECHSQIDNQFVDEALSINDIVNIIFNSINALIEIHSRDIVHGQINPSSFTKCAKLVYKLHDFPVLKDLQIDQIEKEKQMYLSPELLTNLIKREQKAPITLKSDIYSLGIVFLKLVGLKINAQNIELLKLGKYVEVLQQIKIEYHFLFQFIRYYMIDQNPDHRMSSLLLRRTFLQYHNKNYINLEAERKRLNSKVKYVQEYVKKLKEQKISQYETKERQDQQIEDYTTTNKINPDEVEKEIQKTYNKYIGLLTLSFTQTFVYSDQYFLNQFALQQFNAIKVFDQHNYQTLPSIFIEMAIIRGNGFDYERALEVLTFAVKVLLYQNQLNSIDMLFVLLQAAYINVKYDQKKAAQYLKEAENLLNRFYDSNHPLKITFYQIQSLHFHYNQEIDQSSSCVYSSKDLIKFLFNDEYIDILSDYIIAQNHFKKHSYEQSLSYLEKHLKTLSSNNLEYLQSSSLFSQCGQCLLYLRKHKQSNEYFYQSLNILKKMETKNKNIKVKIISLYKNIIFNFDELEDYSAALNEQLKAHELEQEFYKDNIEKLIISFLDLGRAYSCSGNMAKGLEAREKSYKLILENKQEQISPNLEPKVLNKIGESYCELNDNVKCLELYEKAMELYKSLFGENHSKTLKQYIRISSLHQYLKQNDISEKYLTEALNKSNEPPCEGDEKLLLVKVNILNELGKQCRDKNQMDDLQKQLEYYLQAYQILKEFCDPKDFKNILQLQYIGSTYSHLEDDVNALKYYQEALALLEAGPSPNLQTLIDLYENISISYSNMDQFQESHAAREKMIPLIEEFYETESIDKANHYQDIAQSYQAGDDSDKAIEYLLKALDIKQKLLQENDEQILLLYNYISMSYSSSEQYPLAIQYKEKRIKILLMNPQFEKEVIVNELIQLSNQYEGANNLEEALSIGLKAYKLADMNQNVSRILKIELLRNLQFLYELKGDDESALEFEIKVDNFKKRRFYNN